MTIEESKPSSPDAAEPQAQADLLALVRTLARQAEAAEARSAALAERVALLEGRREDASSPERPRTERRVSFFQGRADSFASASAQGREESTRNDLAVSFAENAESGPLKTVLAVPDGGEAEEALADRVLFLERQLEGQLEEKSPLEDRNYALPESTFSLLITHPVQSVPFGFAALTIAISITCLCLTLVSAVSDGTPDNPVGIPAGVDRTVRAAQFIGTLVGVLMENEVPQGLQLIANGAGHTLLLNGQEPVQKRVVVSSALRLVVGYLFLSSLLISVAQNSDVISIFYDLLALEFVENIDDISFALAKRGFFGRAMLIATNKTYNLEISDARARGLAASAVSINSERRLSFSGLITSNNRVNHLVRAVYFINAAILLAGMVTVAVFQHDGRYRCKSINVQFDEEIWERAYVRSGGDVEERMLIYSSFNGIYREEGYLNGYPRYVEQNKSDGAPFAGSVRGAEIVHCDDIGSWVFRHPDILTTPDGEEQNECSWLWRSHQTEDYDLLGAADGAWEAWAGEVRPHASVSIACMECSERSDCNYHGRCGEDKRCDCDESHFGDMCEFELPCLSLATEKAYTTADGVFHWKQDNPIRVIEHRVYNRPLYVQKGLSGEPFDMRLHKILENITSSPSGQPSDSPQYNGPGMSGFDDEVPEDPPTLGLPPSDDNVPTTAPNPVHVQNDYDTAPDFADWDDFFESPSLHPGLEELLEDFQVVISYAGSRFYGTIAEPDADLADLFSPDFHAFWSESFDVDRTFIISDATSSSSPVGIDFFEMRRRVKSRLNPNVHFSYGPFGALIPVMDYEGTGFFHCLDETPQPSSAPSFSGVPSSSPSSSGAPSKIWTASPTGCNFVEIYIEYDENPEEISWNIFKTVSFSSEGDMWWEKELVKSSGDYDIASVAFSSQLHTLCLPEGDYEFTIEDSAGNGFSSSSMYYYKLTSGGQELARGSKFAFEETKHFSIPVFPAPPPLTEPLDFENHATASTSSNLRPKRLFHPRV